MQELVVFYVVEHRYQLSQFVVVLSFVFHDGKIDEILSVGLYSLAFLIDIVELVATQQSDEWLYRSDIQSDGVVVDKITFGVFDIVFSLEIILNGVDLHFAKKFPLYLVVGFLQFTVNELRRDKVDGIILGY